MWIFLKISKKDDQKLRTKFQDRFLHPILVHSILEKKENIGSQNGAHQEHFLIRILSLNCITAFQNVPLVECVMDLDYEASEYFWINFNHF